MSMQTQIPDSEPVIIMSRVYAAPRALVWDAMTKPEHVREWWGGPGFTNPVCEMDLRPDGLWTHVMRFPDGFELRMELVFVEVKPPSRLVWQQRDHGKRKPGQGGLPTSVTTVTLEEVEGGTRWTTEARFLSMADRAAALGIGYAKPIGASSDRLVEYLPKMGKAS